MHRRLSVSDSLDCTAHFRSQQNCDLRHNDWDGDISQIRDAEEKNGEIHNETTCTT